MNSVGNENVLTRAEDYVATNTAGLLGTTVFPEKAIVFPKVGAALLTNKRRLLGQPSCIDNNAMAYVTQRCDHRWMLYFSSTLDFGEPANPGAVPSVNEGQLSGLVIPAPPKEEQASIGSFLDHETARIDALIEKKQRLIELLKEKRQAVITRAVTKGLDPSVPMKDSGVQWLGEVPEHWDVGKLRWQANLQGGVAKGRDLSSAHTKVLPYLRVANVQDGYLDLDEVKEIDLLVSEVERYLLKTGDVLMNEGGDNDKLGRGTVWDGAIAPCVHQNHVFAVRPSAHLCPEWLALFTASSGAKSYFFLRSKQSTNLASISASNVKDIHVPLPPTDEQRSICRSVGEMTGRFDQLIQKSQRSMDLLAEHRSALITAAVTGQIDVRDAA
jgi:type I restriction enzyme S subunit